MSQSSRGCGGIERLYQTPVPDFPTEMRTLEWNYTFAGLRTPESERAWRSLLPFGRGYVLIEEPSAYNLPSSEGEPTPDGTIFSVVLYHQLHCLSVIRRDYFDLVEGVLNNNTDNEMETLVQKQIKTFHNRHCLDYIRQTLECQADMTLEWKRTEPDGEIDSRLYARTTKASKRGETKFGVAQAYMRRKKGRSEEVRNDSIR
ncbi:hypothetical protein BDZ45DRAFT_762166 [Acephala macrosclerotiorum]|nr:hypothetical protein BDZ45DRAFT_762166 [Acephala macrosclerotiorum]